MGGLNGTGCEEVQMMKVDTEMPLEDSGLQPMVREGFEQPMPSGTTNNPDFNAEASLKSPGENDEMGDELQEVNDELESEQVNDDPGDNDSERRSSTSPLKDAFGLVDEFSDSVEEVDNSINGNIEPEESLENTTAEPGDHSVNPLELEDTVEDDAQEETLMVQPEVFENCEENNDVEATSLEEQDEAAKDPFSDDAQVDNAEDPFAEDVQEDNAEDPFSEQDPLLDQNGENDQKSKSIKRKNSDDELNDGNVRKSSRLKTRPHAFLSTAASDTPKKVKMLQKPEERPTQIEETSDHPSSDNEAETEKEVPEVRNDSQGDPSREPGADAERKIDHDLLLPFTLGWKREVIFRAIKTGPPLVDVFYWPPKQDQKETGVKGKGDQSGRKRRSKVDQERYFEEFPHPRLSVNNFSYVRRALGLNNEFYEMVRHSRPGLETRSEKNRRASRKVGSYREVAEHEGLLSTSGSEDEADAGEGIEEVTEFDLGISLSLQLNLGVTPLREEGRRRHKPPPERPLTPPLARDMPWAQLDDDPLGVLTELAKELSTRGSPPTPPPLRALRLTLSSTGQEVVQRVGSIKSSLPPHVERIKEGNKDLAGTDHLASHDLAVKKWKNWRPPGERQREAKEKQEQAWRPPGGTSERQAGNSQATMRKLQANNLRMRATGPPATPTQPAGTPPTQGIVKVRLPMASNNGRRPVVELVMLTEGKYQPIKFTNNRQVTESIPKRLFEQANFLKKTLYQRSVQVPKIGTKQVFLAINPSNAPSGVGGMKPPTPGSSPVKDAASAQVSILVRPAKGGAAVLLNVPRAVAGRVKVGTTLSFSASADQKYTVIDNKMHPPVGQQAKKQNTPNSALNKPNNARIPSLPSGVSIRPVAAGSAARNKSVSSGRPVPSPSLAVRPRPGPPPLVRKPLPRPRPPLPSLPQAPPPSHALMNFTPCSPFCPGVTGIPELECHQCHSLFHPKCVGIHQAMVTQIMDTFKCKRCASSGGGSRGETEVIDLD